MIKEKKKKKIKVENTKARYDLTMTCFQHTGMTPLMYAVKDNRSAFIDRMIELGAEIGARNNVSIRCNENYHQRQLQRIIGEKNQ